jgi:hypothetical protein
MVRRAMHIGEWRENRKERDHLRRPRRQADNTKLDLGETRVGWNGLD